MSPPQNISTSLGCNERYRYVVMRPNWSIAEDLSMAILHSRAQKQDRSTSREDAIYRVGPRAFSTRKEDGAASDEDALVRDF